MGYREKLNEYVVGNYIFPLTHYFYNRRKIINNYKKLLISEHYSQEVLRELQLKRFQQLLEYAAKYIPFYKDRFHKIGLEPQDIKSLEQLKQIPPLNRQEVINFHKEMVDIRLKHSLKVAENSKRPLGSPIPFARFRKHKLIKNTSSGSTGTPTIFYEDGARSALNWCHELRFKSWFGIKLGAKEARLVRLSTNFVSNDFANRIRKIMWGHLVLPGVNLSDEEYRFCLNRILEFRPTVLWGNPWALTGLADYIIRHEGVLKKYNPSLTMTWSGPTYDNDETLLKKAFNCPTTNMYATREVGHIAAKCHQGNFHVNQENLIVETVCLDTHQETENLNDEILVTTLDISPMPFIRYRVGDSGEISQKSCACGRTLQVLQNLHGRIEDIFQTKDGRMISPNFWGRAFNSEIYSGAMKQFQVVYSKSKNIKIRIVKKTGYSLETENNIRELVDRNFPSDTKLTLDYTKKIKPQSSGKVQRVINEGKR